MTRDLCARPAELSSAAAETETRSRAGTHGRLAWLAHGEKGVSPPVILSCIHQTASVPQACGVLMAHQGSSQGLRLRGGCGWDVPWGRQREMEEGRRKATRKREAKRMAQGAQHFLAPAGDTGVRSSWLAREGRENKEM